MNDPCEEKTIYCPYCGEESAGEEIYSDGVAGCFSCMQYCIACGDAHIKDDTHFSEMEVKKDGVWVRTEVCEERIDLLNKYPLDFEGELRYVSDLFERMGDIFRP